VGQGGRGVFGVHFTTVSKDTKQPVESLARQVERALSQQQRKHIVDFAFSEMIT
jgi:hypothetical protein